jgi:membrane dipeptidase
MNKLISAYILSSVAFLGGCSDSPSEEAPSTLPPSTEAPTTQPPTAETAEAIADPNRIAKAHLIIDTHIDVPYRIFRNPADVSTATDSGQFDYPRARAGGLNAPFMSIYIPAAVDEAGDAFSFAEQAITSVTELAAAHPDKFAVATCTQDIYDQFEKGLISLPMGMENGGPIDSKISNLEHFHNKGIRYITLAHSKSNHISDSSYDTNEAWQGLSEFGKTLIGEMNRVGVMIDVSHISDKAFWQVMDLSATPVIASHSSLRHFTPEFQRNMNDEMVTAMAAKGGVIQINFGSSFLSEVAQEYGRERTAAALEHKQANHLADDDPALMEFVKAYSLANPYPFADLDTVLDHIDRAVELGGIDAVGIGSDYDGVGDSLPIGLKDVASYPNLIAGLLGRGYSEAHIAKILGGNLMRVWEAIEQHAADKGTPRKCAFS